MSNVGQLRRWSARLVLVAATLHVLGIAAVALFHCDRLLEIARNYRRETFAAAQERLLGKEYVESIRRLRTALPANETVYLIDEEPTPTGAAYFAVHYLAPRRVVLLSAPARESPKLARGRLPAAARWIVVVRGPGAPLELLSADELRSLLPRADA